MPLTEIILLIIAGCLVGFINTLAGGGSIISLSVLMLMGLPANIANGTNRIAIAIQTLTATSSFRQQKVLATKKGLILGIPTVIGSLIGAAIAAELSEKILEGAFGVILLFMLFFILYKPSRWLKGKEELTRKKIGWAQHLVFFLIGIYGGFIHAGIGYLLLAGIVLGAGYDLVRANALKVLIVFLYTPFALAVFIFNDQVNYEYGFILAIGNVAGALIASRLAVEWGARFVRWIIVVVILLTSGHLLGLYDIQEIFGSFL